MNIPANLSALPWYAAHCQWVVETYGSCAHTPPAGTAASRANLDGANLDGAHLTRASLTRANLTDAYLRGAYLAGANLDGANLARADLTDAHLTDAYLRGANLADAYLRGANLTGAYLAGAYLAGANLDGARLARASDILAVGPLGAKGRLIYAVRHPDGVRIQAGCFWGTAAEIRAAIAVRYADGTGREAHRAAYLGAVDLIEAWAALPVTAS